MRYEEFLEQVKGEVEENLEGDYKITINQVVKNNGLNLSGMVIMEKGRTTAPTIYMDGFYMEYCDGKKMDTIIEDIMDIYNRNKQSCNIDFEFFTEFDRVKDKLVYKILNYEANKELLKDVPHIKYMDLAIVYYVLVEAEGMGYGSVLIHNNHMEVWNTSKEDIHNIACKNTPQLMKPKVFTMENLMKQMMGESVAEHNILEEDSDEFKEIFLFVLTNEQKYFGASTIIYNGLLKKIANKVNDDLFILPSSIHELIIIPQNKAPKDKEYMLEMVKSINADEVDTVDILSDNVYEYSMEKDEVF